MKKITRGLGKPLESLGNQAKKVCLPKPPEPVITMHRASIKDAAFPFQEALEALHFIENSLDQDLVLIDNIPFCMLYEQHLLDPQLTLSLNVIS